MDPDNAKLREDIICKSLIETILKEKYGKDKVFIAFKSKVGSEKGDNFMGDLVACDVEIEDSLQKKRETLHWMIKVMKQGKGIKTMRELNVFCREEAFYTIFQKDLDKYLKPKLLRIVPLVYSVNELDKEALVFQHLGALGYRDPIDKKSGLDDEHVFSICQWLAELHGAAFVLFQKYPGGYENWKKNNFFADYLNSEDFDHVFDMMSGAMLDTLDDLKNGSENDDILEKIKVSLGDFFNKRPDGETISSKFRRVLYNSRSEFKTLCHGDPWFNNMLFKYDENGKIEDVILLDMQVIYSGNIGSDLAYFLISSVTYEDLTTKLDLYLEHYFECLLGVVKKLDAKIKVPLSLEELKMDFFKSSLIGFFFAFSAFPLVLVKKEEVIVKEFTDYDFSNSEDMALMAKEMRAHTQELYKKNKLLYDRMVGAVRFIHELDPFDELH